MLPATQGSSALAVGEPKTVAQERRRHKRVQLTLLGRFMRETKEEYPCKMLDISVGGVAMASPVEVVQGERIVAYFDHLGGLEGRVARVFSGGFAIELVATQHKREKLAAQITWLVNRNDLSGVIERRHERFSVHRKLSNLKLPGGTEIGVKILDVSISGASIGTEARPAIGSEVILGKLRAKVARHHKEGIGLQFTDIQKSDALRRYFGRPQPEGSQAREAPEQRA